MSSIDAVTVALLSNLDALLENSIAPAVSGSAASQVGTQGAQQDKAPVAAPADMAGLAVPEEASLSELAMVLDAIMGATQAVPPAVTGQAPLLAEAPASDLPQAPGAQAPASPLPFPPATQAPQPRAAPVDALHPPVASPAHDLSAALARTVSESGLFYESHLADWLTGQRTLTELMREPQAGAAADTPALATSSNPAASVAPAALPLVRQQLDLLATGQFRWSGEVWPGVHIDWTVEPDQQHADTGDGAGPSSAWRTRITLTLPHLGTVDADLRLNGERLTTYLRASESGARHMQARTAEFARRLSDAGLQLARLSVERDTEAKAR